MGIVIANRKNRCDFGALSPCWNGGSPMGEEFAGPEELGMAPKVLQNLWALQPYRYRKKKSRLLEPGEACGYHLQ